MTTKSLRGHSAEQPARPAVPVWMGIFWFEVRYQLRQPLFYLVTFALSVLLFIGGTDSGASGRLHVNAPAVILEQLLKWIYLVLFLLTAFVISAAVRDFERRTSLIIDPPNGRIPPYTPEAQARRAAAAEQRRLHPADGPWIYYVLEDAEGNHFFTDSSSEFLAAKERCRANDLGCG